MDESTVGILILVSAVLGLIFSIGMIVKYFITHDILTGEEKIKEEEENNKDAKN